MNQTQKIATATIMLTAEQRLFQYISDHRMRDIARKTELTEQEVIEIRDIVQSAKFTTLCNL